MTEHGGELPTCSLVHYKLYFSVQIKSSGLKGIIIIIIIITTITTTTVLWNQAVHTDRGVTANRPDIIIKNKKKRKHAH